MAKPKVIIITQARVDSSRLPRKVLKEVAAQSMLDLHLERISKASCADAIIVATTFEEGAEEIVEIATKHEADSYQGSTDDVLDRFYQAARPHQPDYVVRVTSDCPLLDPVLLDKVVNMTIEQNVDYGANILQENFPDGQDIEVFRFSALEKAWLEAKLRSEREHVTPYIRKNSDFNGEKLFTAINVGEPNRYSHIRMTVDEPEDFEALRALVIALGTKAGWEEYAQYVDKHPSKFKNQEVKRNEGLEKSLKEDRKN